jgi:hypothetical protein
MMDGEMWIQEGAIPVPEGSDLAVGAWRCPGEECDYAVTQVSGSQYMTMIAQCPRCGRTAEIAPLEADQ